MRRRYDSDPDLLWVHEEGYFQQEQRITIDLHTEVECSFEEKLPPAESIDLTLSQEDFDTNTSVGTDVVKKTDAQLDPMLEEGGELPGKNSVKQVRRTNKRDLIPFYFQAVAMQDIEKIHGSRTHFKGLYQKEKLQLGQKLVDA